ncbi:acetate--CoA ligase family protein [Peribacillus psychrosaccharolyticus]|uniref:Acetate--CoA ligase family protein n=1 Tax=Peribacillus psychrosaccharolyticus TaxID=1407 RepID=A0A974S132_PERPY|nr:acetate--CoA ligase family protein [Peribacillus psychrosaccharolyticus]MEC2057399.1 acetate--CoA ligase family protein [Peribacillus psychrosaccharolyticus]MED3742775.1 acetate--CoA ligase family protein [Peribacillus psychrosaccharolyticus]QQT01149.1 acetate--CoA ligase family protein [Peribacillus psychrosaccharolyticus]
MLEEKQTNQSYETLEPLFNPRSVAILGASGNKNKLGNLQVKALLDGQFTGEIYPINSNSTEIEGLTCYKSIVDIPNEVDLAIFCIGSAQVQKGLEECARKKVKAAVIFAAGFSETGDEGVKQENVLREIARENGIRLIGPNCVGLVNLSNGLIGTFSPAILSVPLNEQKGVGYVSQSGAFGVLTFMAAAQNGLSFNSFVSVGNEMETEFADIIEYMIHDPKIKVISGYLEGAKKPEILRGLAKEALDKKKPIIVMKTGRSLAGSKAAASHTGSLAGSDKIYDAFFKQTGIIRADDYEDIISFSKLFLSNKLPNGRNTVIITSSGGRGINEADRCESYGLKIIQLSKQTMTEIKRTMPNFASVSNPIDLTAAASVSNPELFIAPLRALVEDPDVDNIIFTEFPHNWSAEHPLLLEFIDICSRSNKFIFITTFPLEGMSLPPGTTELVQNGIPVIPGHLNPIRGFAKLVEYSEYYRKTQLEKTVESSRKIQKQSLQNLLQPGTTLSELQASEILDRYHIPTTKRLLAVSAVEAIHHANHIGYPVVLKIDSSDIPHKTEAGAIRLNIKNDQEVREAFLEINRNVLNYKSDAKVNGISVQEMLPVGVEVIIGANNDPVFGPVIMFGLGGIFVEIYKDISFRVAPLTREDAKSMIEEIKGIEILKGSRGKASVNIESIIDVLVNVSDLVTDHSDSIEELDINPLIVYEDGIKAADAMLVVANKVKEKTTIS